MQFVAEYILPIFFVANDNLSKLFRKVSFTNNLNVLTGTIKYRFGKNLQKCSFPLAYSRISHEYSSLFIILINLIFRFSL